MKPLINLLDRFRHDRRGNVAMIFALALIPLLAVCGVAIDYARASTLRLRLNAAADAAALSATSHAAIAEPIAQAQAEAEKLFDADAGVMRPNVVQRSVQITEIGLTRTAKVTYTANSQTTLSGIIGINTLTVSSSSTATGTRAPYIDFYLMLDNTPSMGVAATQNEITRMENATQSVRRCAFACHDLGNPNNFYNVAKKIGIQMRIDVVRQAAQQLMDTAKATAKLPGQYRMASYTLGSSCNGKHLTEISGLTEDMARAKQDAEQIDLMTIPYDQFNSDQCTDFDSAFTALNALLPRPGDGSDKSRPQKVVYFVSDGVADYANGATCAKPLAGGARCQEPLDISYCKAIKDRGIKVAVLYTTYLPLPSDGWYNSWVKPFSSQIPTTMQSCASPGLYFEVGLNGGIADAMKALFQQIVATSYLSR